MAGPADPTPAPPPNPTMISAAEPHPLSSASGVANDDLKFDKFHGTLLAMQEILQRMQNMLQRSPHIPPEATDSWSQFWWSYKTVAEEVDAEFYKRYNTDMDTVMIFAGLFTAVSATFAGMMQSSFSPDPTATTQAILQVLVLSLNGTTIPDTIMPVWNGPSATMIWVQCFLYASLACSLFVTLGAVLAKQWLNHFSSVGERGTIEDRGLDRQRKLAGQAKYHFHTVLEILPVILQLSLLLFGLALSVFMLDNQWIIGTVLIMAYVAGALSYFYVVSTSLTDPDSPFYSPLSSVLKKMSGATVRNSRRLRSALATKIKQSDTIRAVREAWSRLLKSVPPVVAAVRWSKLQLRNVVHWLVQRLRLRSMRSAVAVVRWSRLQLRKVVLWLVQRYQRQSRQSTDEEAHMLSQDQTATVNEEAESVSPDQQAALSTTAGIRESSSNVRDRLRVTAILWVLETSTDRSVLSHALAVAHNIYWTDSDLNRLSWSFLDRVIVAGLAECLPSSSTGKFEIPAALRTRAVAYARDFLFFYWEKLAVDPEGFKTWVRTLDRMTVQTWCERWQWLAEATGFRGFVDSKTTVSIVKGSEVFFLVYITFDHLNYVHEYPDRDLLPLLRCRTPSSLTSDMLQARTLVYIAQHGKYPRLSWLGMSILTTRLAQHTQTSHARAIHTAALGIVMRDFMDDSNLPDLTRVLGTNSLTLEGAVKSAIQHAAASARDIRRNETYEDVILLKIHMVSNMIESLPGSLDQNDRDALRNVHVPACMIDVCLYLLINSPIHIVTEPVVSRILQASLAYANTSDNPVTPLLAGDLVWGKDLPTLHLNWLVTLLAKMHKHISNQEAAVWTRSTHVFLVISSLKDIEMYFTELIPALRWALNVSPSPDLWSSPEPDNPLYQLHCATISLIRTLLEDKMGRPRHEQYVLLKTYIPDLPSMWCSLQLAVFHDDYDREDLVMHVVDWMVESAPEDSWVNDPANEVLVRHWLSAVEQRTYTESASNLWRVKASRLVACNALFESSETCWQTPQVQRAAFAVLLDGWVERYSFDRANAYSEEFLCDRTDQLISTDFWKTETQDLLHCEWFIGELLKCMQGTLRKSASERLRKLISAVEEKGDRLLEFRAKAKPQ